MTPRAPSAVCACASGTKGFADTFGSVWEWAEDHYAAFPGFKVRRESFMRGVVCGLLLLTAACRTAEDPPPRAPAARVHGRPCKRGHPYRMRARACGVQAPCYGALGLCEFACNRHSLAAG